MASKLLLALALVASLSGCVVVVNYTGDAAADLALIFDLEARVATEQEKE